MENRYYFRIKNGFAKEKCYVMGGGVKIGSLFCASCEFCVKHSVSHLKNKKPWVVCSQIDKATTPIKNKK